MERQLYRSRGNRMIAGVCGGIAEYFGIDPTIVRLIWVLVTLTYGIGLIGYIIAAIVIPDGVGVSSQEQWTQQESNSRPISSEKVNLVIGGILILIGLTAVSKRFFHWIDLSLLWPVLLIAVGVGILYNSWRKGK